MSNYDYENPYSPDPEDVDFNSAMRINEHDLNAEFMRQPGLISWYGVLEIHAMEEYEQAKTEHDVLVAKVAAEKRKRHELSGQRISNVLIEQMVQMDQKVVDSENILRQARRNKRMASVMFKSIESRMSVLISISANHRSQYHGADPHIRSSGSRVWNNQPAQGFRVDEAMVPGEQPQPAHTREDNRPVFGKGS